MSKKPYVEPQILVEEWKVYKISKSSNQYRKAGIYEVSNFGRVKHNGILIDTPNNHERVKIAGFYVHRAVAELFIPNPENKPEVDHIDTNPSNNMEWNLRWVTSKENSNNPLTLQHLSESMKGKKLSNETKQKASESHKKNWQNSEYRQKQSESHKGEKNSMYGKPAVNKGKHRVYNDPNNYKSGYHYE